VKGKIYFISIAHECIKVLRLNIELISYLLVFKLITIKRVDSYC